MSRRDCLPIIAPEFIQGCLLVPRSESPGKIINAPRPIDLEAFILIHCYAVDSFGFDIARRVPINSKSIAVANIMLTLRDVFTGFSSGCCL